LRGAFSLAMNLLSPTVIMSCQASSLRACESSWDNWFYAHPHPGPLPRGEGETVAASRQSGSRRLAMRSPSPQPSPAGRGSQCVLPHPDPLPSAYAALWRDRLGEGTAVGRGFKIYISGSRRQPCGTSGRCLWLVTIKQSPGFQGEAGKRAPHPPWPLSLLPILLRRLRKTRRGRNAPSVFANRFIRQVLNPIKDGVMMHLQPWIRHVAGSFYFLIPT